MKHKIGFNRLGRKPAHRKALHRNLVTSLVRHERVRTTNAKAKEVRRTAEKMITRAKSDSVHNRRIVGKDIKDQEVLAKLFTDLGPTYKSRPGGYTRILKLGPRKSDGAEMVLLELVGRDSEAEESGSGKRSRRRSKRSEERRPQAETGSPVAEAPSSDADSEES